MSRRQATREQIETAISLISCGGSALCAQMLAWGAFDVLRSIAKARGIRTPGVFFPGAFAQERRKAVIDMYRAAYNFAKHASLGDERPLQFSEKRSDWVTYMAVSEYFFVYSQMTIDMLVYSSWWTARNPGLFERLGAAERHHLELSKGLFESSVERGDLRRVIAEWRSTLLPPNAAVFLETVPRPPEL